jgi:hypothetical protein
MSGHDETIHPDYIPEDFGELLRMAVDYVYEQGEHYSEDALLTAFRPVIDEHDRQIAEKAWAEGQASGYFAGTHNREPISNPYRKENS